MLTRYRRTAPTYDAITRDPFFSFVDRFLGDAGLQTLPSLESPEQGWVPAMDIVEAEEAYTATADLPGVTKDDIDIAVEEGVLTLTGERKISYDGGDEQKGFRRLERAFGSFRRSFTLPQGVDLKKVKAAFADGVLTVTLPKTEIVKARKVTIS